MYTPLKMLTGRINRVSIIASPMWFRTCPWNWSITRTDHGRETESDEYEHLEGPERVSKIRRLSQTVLRLFGARRWGAICYGVGM